MPCHYAKVHYDELTALGTSHGVRGFRPGDKQSSVHKYEAWAKGSAGLAATARVEVFARNGTAGLSGLPRIGDYGRVERGSLAKAPAAGSSLPAGTTAGTIVFTGQPSYWDGKRAGKGSPKHHDFFFYGAAGPAIPVSFSVRQAFSQVHKGSGEQHRLDDNPNREWKYWLERMRRGVRVPVFFLTKDGGDLRAMGLAMMFRLAYDHGTRDAVQAAQAGWDQGDGQLKLDLAEQIFGRVDKSMSLRGRASIETAVEVGQAEVRDAVTAVLGSPRASYYPNYLEQSTERQRYGTPPKQVMQRSGRERPDYQTYMNKMVRARGWKRYVQREVEMKAPPLPTRKRGEVEETNPDVGTTFKPLAASARFRTHLVVHNLRPFELGAILWCLDFGGRSQCRHGLGMAKSLGYGSVRIEVNSTGSDLQSVDGRGVDLAKAREAFAEQMERRIPGWSHSHQIAQLVALATPIPESENDNYRHMQIEHPRFGNEFAEAKKLGLALAPMLDPAEVQRGRPAAGSRGPGPRGGTAPAGSAPAPAGQRVPAMPTTPPPPAKPMDPIERELREAQASGAHVALLRRWIAEGGDAEAARREAALRVIGQPSRQWRESKADVWSWLQGGG